MIELRRFRGAIAAFAGYDVGGSRARSIAIAIAFGALAAAVAAIPAQAGEQPKGGKGAAGQARRPDRCAG